MLSFLKFPLVKKERAISDFFFFISFISMYFFDRHMRVVSLNRQNWLNRNLRVLHTSRKNSAYKPILLACLWHFFLGGEINFWNFTAVHVNKNPCSTRAWDLRDGRMKVYLLRQRDKQQIIVAYTVSQCAYIAMYWRTVTKSRRHRDSRILKSDSS